MSDASRKHPDEQPLPTFGHYFTHAFCDTFPHVASRLHPHQIATAANAYLFRFDKRLSQRFVHRCINDVATCIAATNSVGDIEAHRILRKCARDASRAYFASGWDNITVFVDLNLPLLLDLVQHNDRFALQHHHEPGPLLQSTSAAKPPQHNQQSSELLQPSYTHQSKPRSQSNSLNDGYDQEPIVELDSTQLYTMLRHQAHPHTKQRTTIVVFVYANYCSTCKRLRPIFERAARHEELILRRKQEERQKKGSIGKGEAGKEDGSPIVLYVKLNGPQHPEFRQQYSVKAYPTILRFDPPAKAALPSNNSFQSAWQASSASTLPAGYELNNTNKSTHFPKNLRPSVHRILWFARGNDLTCMSPTGSSPNMLNMNINASTSSLADGELGQQSQRVQQQGYDSQSVSESDALSELDEDDLDDKHADDNGREGMMSNQNTTPLSPRSQQWVPLLKSQGIDELDKLTNERSKIVHRKIDRAIKCNATSCDIRPERSMPARHKKNVGKDPDSVDNFPPMCVLLGGGMGAGKTTVVNLIGCTPFWKAYGDSVVTVEADEFKMSDPLFQFLLGVTPNAASFVHRDSLDAAEQLFVQAVNSRRDIVFDGTLTWHEYARQTIEMLRDTEYFYRRGRGFMKNGAPDGKKIEEYWVRDKRRELPVRPYRVEIVGVTADADISVMRGIVRRITSGRDVSVRHQLNSHRLFSQNFERYIELADATYLFDTTLPSVQEEEEKKLDYIGQLIAFKPGLLFKSPSDSSPPHGQGEGKGLKVETVKPTDNRFIIRSKQAYGHFLKKKGLNISACSATELYMSIEEE